MAYVSPVFTTPQLLKPLVNVSGQGGPTYPALVFVKGHVYLFYLSAPTKDLFHADAYLNRVYRLDEKDVQADITADLALLDKLPSSHP